MAKPPSTPAKPTAKGNPKVAGKALPKKAKVPKEPKKVGRPSDYCQETADLICERLADGESLRRICASDNMPRKATVFRWLNAQAEFRDQYRVAREAQADALFDEMLSIADDGSNDTYLDEEGKQRTDADVIARSKLRVHTRQWMIGKMKPKVYGEKVDLNHGVQPDNPIVSLLAKVAGSALPTHKHVNDGDEDE